MQDYIAKILVAGPVGSGKSTFVRALSDSPFVDTDVLASEEIGKLGTTVGIDFGSMDVDDVRILLFGVPGQERFDFMWDVTCDGAHGLVLLIAANRPACFIQAKKTLQFLQERIKVPTVVGLTHTDLDAAWPHEEVSAYLGIPADCIVNIDARTREGAAEALYVLFEYVSPVPNILRSERSLSLV